jgi:putative ABC transport system substrate-binding protein
MAFPEQTQVSIAAFREGLKAVGLQEGRNIEIDSRWPGVDLDLARALARELIALKPDVIVASSNHVVSVLMQETETVPIVFVFVGDPIGSHYAESLARPEKNLTGFAAFEPSISRKWLELVRELSPQTKRVGFIYSPETTFNVELLQSARGSAPSFGLELTEIPATGIAEIDSLIANFADAGSDGALVVAPHAMTIAARNYIIGSAKRIRLPAVYSDSIFTQSGGLLSLGVDLSNEFRRAAVYVDRILKGEKVSDLPIESTVKYELVINLKTARALDLTIPPTLRARADELIG